MGVLNPRIDWEFLKKYVNKVADLVLVGYRTGADPYPQRFWQIKMRLSRRPASADRALGDGAFDAYNYAKQPRLLGLSQEINRR